MCALPVCRDRSEAPEVLHRLFVDAILHRLEHLEAFAFVLDERVSLAVPPEADPLFEVIEAVQVVLPLDVDDLQHDVPLDAPQDLLLEGGFLVFVLRAAC